MNAYLFSGQGSQYFGMGKALCEASPAARLVYEEASSVLGWDVLRLGADSSEEEAARLTQTLYAQPAILTLSLAAHAALKERTGLSGGAFAGFSLGEYAALSASGVLTVSDAVRLVAERSRVMQEQCECTPGAMFAVLGLDDETVERICAEVTAELPGQFVAAVNYNCPGQVVVAGHEDAAVLASERLKAAGAGRTVRLAVNGAFHTPLMKTAALGLEIYARGLAFGAPPSGSVLYSNTTGAVQGDIPDVPAYLSLHMTSPVRFRAELAAMAAAGCTVFVECGPGKVLCGLVRKTLPGLLCVNVEDERSLEAAAAAIGGIAV
jgi:[acyl-carrier-protein] S-malonyltransferase